MKKMALCANVVLVLGLVFLFQPLSYAGDKILFSAKAPGRSNYDIFLFDVDAKTITTLSDSTADEICPSWSRDGRKIVYASKINDKYKLFYMFVNVNGTPGTPTQIPNAVFDLLPEAFIQNPRFSNDNQKIIYQSDTLFGNIPVAHIKEIKLDGTSPRDITPWASFDCITPLVSPSNTQTKLLYTFEPPYDVLFAIDLNSDVTNTKNHNVLPPLGIDGQYSSILSYAWYQNGRDVLFGGNAYLDSVQGYHRGIYTINSDGTNFCYITTDISPSNFDKTLGCKVALSPDETKIASVDYSASTGTYDLYVYVLDSEVCRKLTNNQPNIPFGSITWSPDGTEIIYNINGKLYRVNADGTSQPQPIYSLSSFTLEPRSEVAFRPAVGNTNIIYVPGDYPTIRQALAAAQPGYTIKVAAGRYPEGGINGADYMNINKDGIQLIGYDPADPDNPNPTNKPLIYANGFDYGLRIAPVAGDPDNTVRNITVENFIIQDYQSNYNYESCGILIQNADTVKVRNNIIGANCFLPGTSTRNYEFAICLSDSKNVEISNNELKNAGRYNIYLLTRKQDTPNANINIMNNKFSSNSRYSIFSASRDEYGTWLTGYDFFPNAKTDVNYPYQRDDAVNGPTKGNIFYKGTGSRLPYAMFMQYGGKYFTKAHAPEGYSGAGTLQMLRGLPYDVPARPENVPYEVIYSDRAWRVLTGSGNITLAYDNELGANVTRFNGTYSPTYILGPSSWDNPLDKVIQWRMKSSNDYTVYVNVKTNKGSQYIVYQSYSLYPQANGRYAPIILGNATKGSWVTITRNLQEDLAKTYNAAIETVNAFLIRGPDRISLVKMIDRTPDATVYSDGTNPQDFYFGNTPNITVSSVNGAIRFSGNPIFCILGDSQVYYNNAWLWRNPNGNPWVDTNHKRIQWDMKFKNWYMISVLVEAKAKGGGTTWKEIVYYSDNAPNVPGSISYSLGKQGINTTGLVIITPRDLNADLGDTDGNGKKDDVISVNGIIVATSGEGFMDNIKLLK
jgi:hypothetical protein